VKRSHSDAVESLFEQRCLTQIVGTGSGSDQVARLQGVERAAWYKRRLANRRYRAVVLCSGSLVHSTQSRAVGRGRPRLEASTPPC
jgi:hypothetical protein